MNRQKETPPFHKPKDSQTLHPVFFKTNKQKEKKLGKMKELRA